MIYLTRPQKESENILYKLLRRLPLITDVSPAVAIPLMLLLDIDNEFVNALGRLINAGEALFQYLI